MNTENMFQKAPEKKKFLTLLALYVGIIGSIFVSATSSTMLPAAALEIGGKDIYSLVTTISGVVSVVAMPLYGYIAAKMPHFKTKLFGISMLIGAAVMLSRVFVNNMWAIIIPGALYGLVSAAVYVIGYSMIRDIYDSKKAAVYLGLVGTMQSIGMLVGPALCGIIIDASSWRNVNHIIWPFMLLSGIFALSGVRVSKEDVKELAHDVKFDGVGAVFLVLFLGGVILGLSLGTSFAPFGSPASWLLIAIAVVGLIGLIFDIRAKGQASIVPASVLKDKNTRCLALANLSLNWSTMAAYFFIPTYCMYVIKVSATQAGMTTTLMSVAGLFMGPIFGRMIGKAGNARGVLIGGTSLRILITLAFILLLKPTTNIIVVYVLAIAAGFYGSQTGVTFAVAPQIQIRQDIRVQSNSIIQICQNFGGGVGTAVYTMVIGLYGIERGMIIAFIIALITAALGLAASLPLSKLESETTVA